jgi:hypothetical protein
VGFAVAALSHVPLLSGWLVGTYVLIVVALATQAALMVPLQVRAERSFEAGTLPRLGSATVVLVMLCIIYTAIVALMLVRPG